MKLAILVVPLLMSATPTLAQTRRALMCSEDVSLKLNEPTILEEPKIQEIARRTFSLVFNGELLSLISAGKSEFFECQRVTARLNEGRPRNSIKCQNGIYFLTIDFTKLRFVRSEMNPEQRSDVRLSYGICGPL